MTTPHLSYHALPAYGKNERSERLLHNCRVHVALFAALFGQQQVNLINANIDRASRQHLKQHPRVKLPGGGIWTKESQEWGGLAGELGFGGDDEDGEDEDDIDDDPGKRCIDTA